MKGRSPKAEGRGKSEVRTPKSGGALLAVVFVFGPRLLLAADTNSPGAEAIPPLRPARGELGPTFWEQYSYWVILVGAFVLALAAIAVWLLTRPKPPVIARPEAQARAALEPLRQQPEDGALLSRASHILHEYIIAAFRLLPGERTTTEFCREVARNKDIGPELAAALSDFLRRCDRRKFSPPVPAPPLSAVADALKLIEQSEARIAAGTKANAPAAGSTAPHAPGEVAGS